MFQHGISSLSFSLSLRGRMSRLMSLMERKDVQTVCICPRQRLDGHKVVTTDAHRLGVIRPDLVFIQLILMVDQNPRCAPTSVRCPVFDRDG